MAKPLQGTVALVTGASSGIGEATALALAEQGANVAVAARRVDRLEALAERIRQAGSEVLVLETDVTKEDQAREMVEKTVARFARLDTLVNNAGLMLLGPAVGADVTEWVRMMELNVEGLMYCTHYAMPHLLGRGAAGTAARRRPRQHQLRRGPRRARGRRRLQRDEVRGGRVQRSAAAGGHAAARARLPDRAGDGCDGAAEPQPAGDPHSAPPRPIRFRSRCKPRTSPTRSSTSSRVRATSGSTKSSSARPSRSAERGGTRAAAR